MNFMAIDAVLLTGPEKYSLFLSLGYLYFFSGVTTTTTPVPTNTQEKINKKPKWKH